MALPLDAGCQPLGVLYIDTVEVGGGAQKAACDVEGPRVLWSPWGADSPHCCWTFYQANVAPAEHCFDFGE